MRRLEEWANRPVPLPLLVAGKALMIPLLLTVLVVAGQRALRMPPGLAFLLLLLELGAVAYLVQVLWAQLAALLRVLRRQREERDA